MTGSIMAECRDTGRSGVSLILRKILQIGLMENCQMKFVTRKQW